MEGERSENGDHRTMKNSPRSSAVLPSTFFLSLSIFRFSCSCDLCSTPVKDSNDLGLGLL